MSWFDRHPVLSGLGAGVVGYILTSGITIFVWGVGISKDVAQVVKDVADIKSSALGDTGIPAIRSDVKFVVDSVKGPPLLNERVARIEGYLQANLPLIVEPEFRKTVEQLNGEISTLKQELAQMEAVRNTESEMIAQIQFDLDAFVKRVSQTISVVRQIPRGITESERQNIIAELDDLEETASKLLENSQN